MKLSALEAVVRALNDANVRYLIAGGLAVNAHGYVRATHDIDVVLALDPDNVSRALEALADTGYRPAIPVTAAQFADAETRRGWIRDKGMQVLNLFSDSFPGISVDIFVEEPFDFPAEWHAALRAEILAGLTAPFVTIETLIRMKERAGRHRDLDDIQHLRWIQEEGGTDA